MDIVERINNHLRSLAPHIAKRETADLLRNAVAEIEHLRILLAHAVKEADGWHDDAHGGPIKDNPMIDEARALLNNKE